MTIPWLDPADPRSPFPPVESALEDPDGLLAAGGDLSVTRLLRAYRRGIFPWYEQGQPILWWSPDPRTVLFPHRLKLRRSLRKVLRNRPWTVSLDADFARVVAACAAPRPYADGTWITPEMMAAYLRMHEAGHGHSAEVRDENGELIGGLYGVALGRVFFGESMFSRRPDASKVALAVLTHHLQHWGYPVIDCQMESPHILSLGAEPIARNRFIEYLDRYCAQPGHPAPWRVDPQLHTAEWQPEAGV